MCHLLLAAVLVAFAVPAIADTDNTSLARPPARILINSVQQSGAGGAIASAVPMTSGSAGTGAGRLAFAGAVVTPAGGAHPDQPVITRREVVQTIRKGDYRVLEIAYQ
jgi:hypothetical protein